MTRITQWAAVLGAVLTLLTLAGCSPEGMTAARAQSPAAEDEPGASQPTTADPAAVDEHGKTPVDPVKANGPIFVDWKKPDLAIVLSGELDGYLEPCGCAGLENQLGGLKRRHTLIKQLEEQGWPLALLDMGGLTKRVDLQTDIKYRYALESLVQIGYQAIALGGNELKLNVDGTAGTIMNLTPEKNPIVSANVGVYGMEESVSLGISKPFRVITVGGKRIGVTAVLGAKHREALKNIAEVATTDAAAALAQVAPQLAAEKCDFQVLMVHGDPVEAANLSRQFPQFQIVATTGGAEEPPARSRPIAGSNATLIEAGHKGMYVIVLGIYDGAPPTVSYQRVPLDARFADSPEMQARLVAYQKELETMTLAGLGLTGTPHPDGDFAGSAVCGDCHTKAWAEYEKTPHYHATDTLVKLDPPRQFDPECLSCHVTGWSPQQYLPYSSGFASIDATPDLMQNGCENCHGPAADHVKVELGEVNVTPAEQEALRAALRLKIGPNEGNKEGQDYKPGSVVENCMRCHDLDNSPDFDFQTYWPKVKHAGKD